MIFVVLALSIDAGGCGSSDRPGPGRPEVERAPVDGAVPADASRRVHPGPETGDDRASEKHLTLDDEAAPANHTDRLWGDYIDKNGKAAVGWHSHDPTTGNAR